MDLQEKIAERDRLNREIVQEREAIAAASRSMRVEMCLTAEKVLSGGGRQVESSERKCVQRYSLPGVVTVLIAVPDGEYTSGELSVQLEGGVKLDFSEPVSARVFARVLEALIPALQR
jgi:hypothetical protein